MQNRKTVSFMAVHALFGFMTVIILIIGGVKGWEQQISMEAKKAEREYIFTHWDKVITGTIRENARKELKEGVK